MRGTQGDPGAEARGGPTDPRAEAPEIDRATLRSALAARRDASYQNFLTYREARVYPVNSYAPGFQHVWLDASGNLCAAATIIAADWGRAAAEAVAGENNFIALADVHDGPLYDWVLTSGLTHQEIRRDPGAGVHRRALAHRRR